jgi:hypothetical protein
METARFSETLALSTNPHGDLTQKNIIKNFYIFLKYANLDARIFFSMRTSVLFSDFLH